MYILKDCSYAEKKLDERWRTLLEEEIDNCAPMTFIACTAVAGMVSEFRAEESVKLVLSHGGRELDFIANTALLFASRGGYIPCENAKFKINSKEASDGGTYLMDRIPVMQEILTKNDYYTHHKTIIVVDEEWMEGPFDGYPKMKGPLPTVWLEIKPGVFWYKYKESALRVDSAYRDVKLRVSPKGTYANYKKMLKEDVIGHTPMEFLLSASISGLLVDYLKESISVENIMVHMIGESSTGKTTGALLAVSCGSAPDFLGNNFVFSFQDTLNSLMRLIPNSYPTLIDEGSLLTDRDMTQTLYSLSSGTEKRRLSGGMEVNESSRFRTALFLTSEKSILAQCNMNTGLLTRNFEFQNVTWTSSAESADRIKSVVTENYGHIIPRVAKWLLAQDRQELVEKIVQETNAVIKRAREAKTYNNLTERTAKQSALILVAVDIVNEVLKLKLNKEAIGDFMEEHSLVNSVEQVSIGKRAMEWLLQFISKNYTQFLSKDSPKEISNCRGKLENMQTVLLNTDEESGMRLKVTESEFMKILKEGHFSEKATVLKEWKEMGYLKAQSDRYISRIKIVGDIQVKGYIIQLPVPSNKIGGDGVKDYEEVLEERRKRINKPRQVIKDEYVEDDFFSIDDDDDLDFPEDWK